MERLERLPMGSHVWIGYRQKRQLARTLKLICDYARGNGQKVYFVMSRESVRQLQGIVGSHPIGQVGPPPTAFDDIAKYTADGQLDQEALLNACRSVLEGKQCRCWIVLEVDVAALGHRGATEFEQRLENLATEMKMIIACAHKISKKVTSLELDMARGHTHLVSDMLICPNPGRVAFTEAFALEPGESLKRMLASAAFFERRRRRQVRSGKTYKAIYDNIDTSIVALNAEGRILAANPAARKALSLPRAWKGTEVIGYFHQADRSKLSRAIARLLERQPRRVQEMTISTAGPNQRRLLVSLLALEQLEDSEPTIYLLGRDETERDKLAAELLKRGENLELLRRLDVRLGQTLDLSTESELFLEVVEHAVDCKETALWRVTDQKRWLELVGYRNLEEPVLDSRIPYGMDPVAWFARYLSKQERPATREAIAAIPLSQEDRLLGVLCAVKADRRPFLPEDISLLSTMCGIMARVMIRLDDYRQLEDSRRYAERQREAAEVVKIAASVAGRMPEPEEFFETCFEAARALLGRWGLDCALALKHEGLSIWKSSAEVRGETAAWLRNPPSDIKVRLSVGSELKLEKGDRSAPDPDSCYYVSGITATGFPAGRWAVWGAESDRVFSPLVIDMVSGVCEQAGHYLTSLSAREEARREAKRSSAFTGFVTSVGTINRSDELIAKACESLTSAIRLDAIIAVVCTGDNSETQITSHGLDHESEHALERAFRSNGRVPACLQEEAPRRVRQITGKAIADVLGKEVAYHLDAATLIVVPFQAGVSALGCLYGIRRSKAGFDSGDLATAEGIARLTAVALTDIKTYRQALEKTVALSKKVEEIRHMHRLDRLMLSALEKEKVLTHVADRLLGLVPVDVVSIGLLADSGDKLLLVHTSPSPTPFIPDQLSIRDSAALSQAVAGRITYYSEARVEAQPATFEARAADEGYRSQLWLPLSASGTVLGVMTVFAKRPAAIEESHLGLLDSVGTQAAVALRNSQLYEANVTGAQRLMGLNSANSVFGADTPLEEALTKVGYIVRSILDCKYVAVGVYDLAGRFRFVPTGVTEDEVRRIGGFPRGKGLLGYILRSKSVVVLEDLRKHAASVGFPKYHPHMKTFLGAPIRFKEQVLGSLYATEKRQGVFTEDDKDFMQLMTGSLGIAIRNSLLFEQLQRAFLAIVKALGMAVEARDPSFTHRHLERIPAYATRLAELAGADRSTIEGIEAAAYLHDLGKIGVPEAVLSKTGPLTEEDWKEVRRHPLKGYEIIGMVSFPWPVHEIVRYHHERYDGTGYPEGIKGEAIPLGARIIAIVDAWDAMRHDRPYREKLTPAQARRELVAGKGTQFDPRLVDLFLDVLNEEEARGASAA